MIEENVNITIWKRLKLYLHTGLVRLWELELADNLRIDNIFQNFNLKRQYSFRKPLKLMHHFSRLNINKLLNEYLVQ